MKLQTRVSVLVVAASLAATCLAIGPGTAAAGMSDTLARPGAPGQPKLVEITSNDKRVTVSDAHFRPGVTEFRVSKTAHRRTSITIFETKNVDRLFTKFGEAGQSADAMKTVNRIATFYGGGGEGTRWQVSLSKGSYYVIGDKNNLTTIKVTGEGRNAKMAKADSEIWTTKDNQFKTSGRLSGKWVSFTNHSREIHFVEGNHVAADTSAKDVRQGLKSPDEPTWIKKGGFHFDIQSPGIKTVHRQNIEDYKYLLMCWMPSEEQDGVPHAMMGMWHLVWGS